MQRERFDYCFVNVDQSDAATWHRACVSIDLAFPDCSGKPRHLLLLLRRKKTLLDSSGHPVNHRRKKPRSPRLGTSAAPPLHPLSLFLYPGRTSAVHRRFLFPAAACAGAVVTAMTLGVQAGIGR